jgi:hypothetical protein
MPRALQCVLVCLVLLCLCSLLYPLRVAPVFRRAFPPMAQGRKSSACRLRARIQRMSIMTLTHFLSVFTRCTARGRSPAVAKVEISCRSRQGRAQRAGEGGDRWGAESKGASGLAAL